MSMKIAICGFALLLLLTVPCLGERPQAPAVLPDYTNGNGLLRLCQPDEFDPGHYQFTAFCIAYTTGVRRTAEFLSPTRICMPNGATAGQQRDIVIQFLRDHPGRRQEDSVPLVIESLSGAWPCKSN